MIIRSITWFMLCPRMLASLRTLCSTSSGRRSDNRSIAFSLFIPSPFRRQLSLAAFVSSTNSSSMVQSRARASAGSLSLGGLRVPLSHCDTVFCSTPTSSPSCRCDLFTANRCAFIVKGITSISLFGIILSRRPFVVNPYLGYLGNFFYKISGRDILKWKGGESP